MSAVVQPKEESAKIFLGTDVAAAGFEIKRQKLQKGQDRIGVTL